MNAKDMGVPWRHVPVYVKGAVSGEQLLAADKIVDCNGFTVIEDVARPELAPIVASVPELLDVATQVDLVDRQARHSRKDGLVFVDYYDWQHLASIAKAAIANSGVRS